MGKGGGYILEMLNECDSTYIYLSPLSSSLCFGITPTPRLSPFHKLS